MFFILLAALLYVARAQTRDHDGYFGNAYIISLQPFITEDIKRTATDCGFRPIFLPAARPYSQTYRTRIDMVEKVFVGLPKEIIVKISDDNLSMREIALISSHRNAIDFIANNSKTSDSDWSLILEEDARIHPSLVDKIPEVRAIVSKAVAYADKKEKGFIYFGICGGGCAKKSRNELIGIDCWGSCTHAYAITKKLSKSLFYDIYDNNRKERHHIDSAYKEYFNTTMSSKKPIIVGYSYVAPNETTHRGIIYQLRVHSPGFGGTTLDGPGSNNLTGLVQYRSVFSGRLGNIMFEHAALVGLCVKRGFSPNECACHLTEPSLNGKYNELPLEEFITNFQIPKVEFNQNFLPSKIFVEHEKLPYDIRFDPLLFDQPAGTILQGYFQSFKYFHPHASDVIREIYTFPPHIQLKSAKFLADIRAKKSPNNQIVCMSIRRGDKTDAKATKLYPTWALSMDYYMKAIEVFVRSYHGNVALVIFTGGGFSQSVFDADRRWVQETMDAWLQTLPDTSIQIFYDDLLSNDHLATMHTISQCPNIIMASSSYSWWSAYLSGHSNIVAPKYPQDESGFVPEDYYPPSWTLLDEDFSIYRMLPIKIFVSSNFPILLISFFLFLILIIRFPIYRRFMRHAAVL